MKAPDIQIDVTLAGGRKMTVNALLVDNISSAPASFYTRYEGLSTEADLIFYNGHAGLGQNVRALAKRGEFRAEKYQIFFMNGCDTFAYVDGSLAKTRAVLNPDDPTGTKYMDMVTNAMPASSRADSAATASVESSVRNTSTGSHAGSGTVRMTGLRPRPNTRRAVHDLAPSRCER